jgi:hypothetical protein
MFWSVAAWLPPLGSMAATLQRINVSAPRCSIRWDCTGFGQDLAAIKWTYLYAVGRRLQRLRPTVGWVGRPKAVKLLNFEQ